MFHGQSIRGTDQFVQAVHFYPSNQDDPSFSVHTYFIFIAMVTKWPSSIYPCGLELSSSNLIALLIKRKVIISHVVCHTQPWLLFAKL